MAARENPPVRLALATLACLVFTGPAAAQEVFDGPDLRGVEPFMMLVVDTSGSMERLPDCECADLACTRCTDGRESLPDCSLANVSEQPPNTGAPNFKELKKNRWAMTLEALTGTFTDFECTPLARTTANGMTYDEGYHLNYYQPWACPSSGACDYLDPLTPCVTDADCAASSFYRFCDPELRICSAVGQTTNGILDQYRTEINFGLMTFDGYDTYLGAGPLVPASAFRVDLSEAEDGLWSYGGAKRIHYPNCTTDYMMDTGARSEAAEEGSLISLSSCSDAATNCPSWCSSCPGTQSTLNGDIQRSLLVSRPYGGTPIAASLDDLYTHLEELNADPFFRCRPRYGLLITDGYPDDDYRAVGCACTQNTDPNAPDYCGGPPIGLSTCDDPATCPNHPSNMHCPYPLAEDAAASLVAGEDQLNQLFVVGLSIDDLETKQGLDLIAANGDPSGDTTEALLANNLSTLFGTLSGILSGLVETLSRSVPAFSGATGNAETFVSNEPPQQYQVSTGFRRGAFVGSTFRPWTGVIEKRSWFCRGTSPRLLQEEPLSVDESDSSDSNGGDRFHAALNGPLGDSRDLWTVLPASSTPDSHLYYGNSGDPCGISGCSKLGLSSLTAANLGVATTAERDTILAWMRGDVNSARQGRRMGDIIHSSPVVVGVPRFDISDEAFNLFRQQVVNDRPLTLYIASNDGILHAFSMERNDTHSLQEGEEIWGFVPPVLLNDLQRQLDSHVLNLDATPVVKNVFFERALTVADTVTEYHTVLILGMRTGGNSYIALDVTDPMAPRFLWQFTDPDMGLTYGQAALGQAFYRIDVSGTPTPKHRAVAILPGGVGEIGGAAEVLSGVCNTAISTQSIKDLLTNSEFTTLSDVPEAGPNAGALHRHRDQVRCWKDKGRAVYFVDVENGQLIKKLHDDGLGLVFPSPIVSTPALYQADVSTTISRAFVVDADGVIWRLDLSDNNQDVGDNDPDTGWRALPFHDIFWDRGASEGQPTYSAPILSVDGEGRVVVLVGTGDTEDYELISARNRIVSVTEVVPNPAVTGPGRFKAAFNWEKRVKTGGTVPLVTSELVTGQMALFAGQLFVPTFISLAGSGNACDLGSGRIHGLHYRDRNVNDPNGTNPPTFGPALLIDPETDGNTIINVDEPMAVENLLLLGLSIIERPRCQELTPTDDPFNQSLPNNIGQVEEPALFLVAQGSGDNDVLEKRANSAIRSLELQVNKDRQYSRVRSWAASID